MAYKVITAPSVEPITLALAKAHLRLIATDDDSYLETVTIPSARQYCEYYLERSLAEQTIEIALDFFPDQIKLPRAPVKSITSIKYSLGGTEQTLDAQTYVLDNYLSPAWISPAVNASWPLVDGVPNAIKVRYITGYDAIPAPVISAMLLIIGHLYENRQENVIGGSSTAISSLPMGVMSLLSPYRLGMGV